jgi:hypothetical protein
MRLEAKRLQKEVPLRRRCQSLIQACPAVTRETTIKPKAHGLGRAQAIRQGTDIVEADAGWRPLHHGREHRDTVSGHKPGSAGEDRRYRLLLQPVELLRSARHVTG